MNLPNALTVLRILLIPVFAWAYYKAGYGFALAVFVLASVTDYLDGYLARKNHQITNFGKLADPFADKLMLLTMLACLADTKHAPWWLFWMMVGKEGLMVIGSLFMLKKKVVVYANWFGKIGTVLFIAAIVFVFPWHSVENLRKVGNVLMYVALACSFMALGSYVRSGLAAIRKDN